VGARNRLFFSGLVVLAYLDAEAVGFIPLTRRPWRSASYQLDKMDIIIIKIFNYDIGRDREKLLDWLRTGMRVMTNNHFEIKIEEQKEKSELDQE